MRFKSAQNTVRERGFETDSAAGDCGDLHVDCHASNRELNSKYLVSEGNTRLGRERDLDEFWTWPGLGNRAQKYLLAIQVHSFSRHADAQETCANGRREFVQEATL